MASPRVISKHTWRVLRCVLAVGLLLAVVFVAFVRTEAGRNAVRMQIEDAFNERFAGTLDIGRLDGNLVVALRASDVSLRDPGGDVVASIDSVVVRPWWRALLGRRLGLRGLTVVRPRLTLVRDTAGTWNAARALQRRDTTRARRGIPHLAFVDVRVKDGTVVTRNRGDTLRAVRTGWLVDPTRARLDTLNAHLTVDWGPEDRHIDVFDAQAALPFAQVRLRTLQAQALGNAEGWAFNRVRLETDASTLHFDARTGRTEGAPSDRDAPPSSFAVDFEASRLSFDEVRRLVPNLPLADAVALTGRVSGTAKQVLLDRVAVERGASRLAVSGTAYGLPDSLDVEVDFAGTRLRVRDLRALAPRLRLPPSLDARLGTTRVERLYVQGRWLTPAARRPPGTTPDTTHVPLQVRTELALASPAGAVAGTAEVRQVDGRVPRYAARLDLDSLNAGRLAGVAALASRLEGEVTFEGAGRPGRDDLRAQLDVRLGPSSLNGRPLDALTLTGTLDGPRLDGVLDVQQTGPGRLRAEGFVAADSVAGARYQLDLVANTLDLRALPWGRLPATRLNARLDATGRGTTWNDLAATFTAALDSSSVVVARAEAEGSGRTDATVTLAPQRHRLALTQAAREGPRLHLTGDVADLTLDGDLDPEALLAVGQLWQGALREAAREAFAKPYAARDGAPGPASAPGGAPGPRPPRSAPTTRPSDAQQTDDDVVDDDGGAGDLTAAREAVRAALRRRRGRDGAAASNGAQPPDAAADALHLSADVHLKRPDLVRALWPAWPVGGDGLTGAFLLDAGADTLDLRADLQGKRLATARATAHGTRVTLTARAALGPDATPADLTETLTAALDAEADSVRASGYGLVGPTLALRYADRRARLDADVSTRYRAGPFRLGAALDLEARRNVLTVDEVHARLGPYLWTNEGPARADLYADAVVVPGFVLSSPRPALSDANRAAPSGEQRITVSGTLAGAATDSVAVALDGVLVHPFSNLLRLKYPLGGLVDGRLTATGGLDATRLGADLRVARVSFDRRLLGRLRVQASHQRGVPEVALFADLTPEADTSLAPVVPGGMRRAEASRLSLGGTVGTKAPRALDLSLDVTRADLFFFEYIFRDVLTGVEGYTAGTGHVGGVLTDPVFDADMRVEQGRFQLPDYGLDYRAEGTVRVDREGFKLRDVVVRGGDGQATLVGGILFNDYRFFSFDLHATLNELPVMNVADPATAPGTADLPFYGELMASGRATLAGPLSDSRLRSDGLSFTDDSELFLPISEGDVADESGFIIFADSTGRVPDFRDLTRRDNLLSKRPPGEASFVDGMDIDLNLVAPPGSVVHLVFDPLIGDVVNAVGSGRVQLQRREGEFFVYGTFDVTRGDYLFVANDVFVRRFDLTGGTLSWDGDPVNAALDLDAAYRTRAARDGLPEGLDGPGRLLVDVTLDITGRVEAPRVELGLAFPRADQTNLVGNEAFAALLNRDEIVTEYATSVLLTNTFLLTTSAFSGQGSEGAGARLTSAGNQLAFNSLSQLVASQLNRYLSAALPNIDVNLGIQGENPDDLDVVYGLALRLLDDRLVIRGEGIYAAGGEADGRQQAEGPQGEFVVEVRLSRTVSVEAFYRRTGDDLTRDQALTSTAGAGLSYQTEFTTWQKLAYRLFGWLGLGPDDDDAPAIADDANPNANDGSANDDGKTVTARDGRK